MADDIDIEEHDVLESLRRRRAPDAVEDTHVIVKSEPVEIEYDESNNQDQGNLEYQWEWDKNQAPEIKVEPCTEEFRFGKIILGSKPAEPQNTQETAGACFPILYASLISGQDVQENYNFNMSLVLDNWGPMLERSDCYCKECQTLFATVNALDAHKMIAHSFLVATDKLPSPDRNKAVKSTAKPSNSDDNQTCQICHYHFQGTYGKSNLMRHYKRIHRVDPSILDINKDYRNWRLCNHCNDYFPDDTSLVKHLYELLPINNKPPAKEIQKAPQSVVKAKPALNIDKSNAKVNKDVIVANVKASSNDKDNNPLPNRIILGSKPATATTESVAKEDNSNKWTCEICGIEYCRKYYLVHMNRFHPETTVKRLKGTNREQPEKIISNKCIRYKCSVCNEILTSDYAVRKHRLKHPNTKGTRGIITKFVKFNKTNKVKVRPNLIKKEPVKVNSPKMAPKIVKKEPMEENTGILVSKSTLFKCNRCSVHFLTCTGACQHSIVCETSSNIRDWACPKCQRVFKSAEKTAHEYQHQVMNANKFKVYVVYLEMIVRILCECPECFVCFEEDKFARHISGGCHDAASYYCNECRLSIDVHSKANHDSKHKQGDFKKDDFIKIDYVSSKRDFTQKNIKKEIVEETKNNVKNINVEIDTPKNSLKRKLDVSGPHERKRSRLNDELHLYYCTACRSVLVRKVAFHFDGKCREAKYKHRCLCKICGIYFKETYYKSHMRLHEKNPNLKLSDFTFTRISDSKKIKPPPELHPCRSCKINFLTKAARFSHKCGNTPSTNCLVCQKKVQKDAFKLHMQLHDYVIPKNIKSVNDVTSKMTTKADSSQDFTRKATKSSPVTKLPDLLMKYESLTALWNILYLCATCDTFTDSYDKVVEHCQNHLTNMENYGVVIVKCPICNMKFDSDCYKRHLELHSGNKVINKKTFQILKYDYNNLFSDEWFDFLELPEEQKSQILSRSIYGATRCVKMRLVQQGPPEYTLYKCSKCLNCVATDTIVHHFKLACCVRANKIACSLCEMTFTMRSQCEEHEKIHQTTGLGLQSFRIVAFNDEDDAGSNAKIMSYDSENHGSKSRISFTDTDEEPSQTTQISKSNVSGKLKSFVLYKCDECQSCVLHIRNFARHACNKNSPKKECDKCGVLISVKHYSTHERLHKKYTFSRKNVITKTLNKDGKVINIKKLSQEKNAGGNQTTLNDAAQKPNLYKCYCGIHYTSLKTIEKHYKMKNCSTVIREKCSQCNLIFDPIEVVNHLCKHHAQKHVTSFNIITPNKKTLYKCSLCHVLFYNKERAIPHKANCAGKYCGKKCEKCGLAFDATSLDTHMIDHERNNKLRTDCYVIVQIPGENTDYTNKDNGKLVSSNILYKGTCCNIHFLMRSSARNHLLKSGDCHSTVTQICKLCNLEFSIRSMPKHMGWQHNAMKVNRFKVIELVAGVNTKDSKVEYRETSTVKPKVIKQEKPVIQKTKPVNVTVYRCLKCMVHFTDENGLVNHLEDRCSKELTSECDDCAIKFASRNIKEHRKNHGLGTLTMNIIDDVEMPPVGDEARARREEHKVYEPIQNDYLLGRYDNKLYKCTECNFHYNTYRTLEIHRNHCDPSAEGLKCETCDVGWFTKISLHRHGLIHQKYKFTKDDFVVVTLDDGDIPRDESQNETETKQEIGDVEVSLDASFVRTEKPRVYERKSKKYSLNKNVNKLYRCIKCNFHYNVHNTLVKHSCIPGAERLKCETCGIGWFTKFSLQRHQLIHKEHNLTKGDFVVYTLTGRDSMTVELNEGDVETKEEIEQDAEVSQDSSFDVESTAKPTPGKSKDQQKSSNIHYLFKCAECNVYFGTQKTCHKHIAKHTPLDPKEYIECKLCGFQFTIMGLQPHIKKYHEKPLNLEEVLVEEYQPNDFKVSDKYYASEKDQSRLVSTSDDVKIVSTLKEDNDCEVSSCNEIAENVDSTNNDGNVHTDVKEETKVNDEIPNDLEEIAETSVCSVLNSDDNVKNGQDTE